MTAAESLIRVVNRYRAHRIRRALEKQGIDLAGVRCSHRLQVVREGGTATSEHFRVGNDSALEGRFVVGKGGRISIGRHCSFRFGTQFSAKDCIVVGDHVFGSENVFVSDNNNHPISPHLRYQMTLAAPGSPPWKMTDDVVSSPVQIRDGVWLGRSVMILKGVTIGKWSIVAAGAVVTKEVPPFCVVAGNPAKIVKEIDDDLVP